MKRLLLLRTDAVGDLILTLPVARAIKEKHPDTQITLLASRYTAPLIADEKYIDQIVTIIGRSLDSVAEIRGMGRDLRKMGFDRSIMFYPRLSLALACYLAGIPERVGTARRGYSLLFNRRVPLQRRGSGRHELELNFDLARQSYPDLPFYEPQVSVTANEQQQAQELLSKAGIARDERFVIIHPLSQGSSPNWRIGKYAKLADCLAARGIKVVLTGSQLESGTIGEAFAGLGNRVVNLAGMTELSVLKGIIQTARLLVSGSTGPIHIASAVSTFAVGIYPPESALSVKRWGPRGGANKLFVPGVNGYNGRYDEAMDLIDVETVAKFILERLEADK